MPDYFFNNIQIDEQRVLNNAKKIGLSIDDYLEQANITVKEPEVEKPTTRETSWWRGEEGLIPDELQGIQRPDVEVDAQTFDPIGEIKRQSKMTQKDVLIDVYGTSDKKEIEEIKYKKSPIGKFMTEHNKKHEETKKRLIDMYGTSDPEQIIALEATNKDGSLKNDMVGDFVSGLELRDDKTLLNKNNLPTWEDKEIMDYVYAPYMRDAQTIPNKFLDFVGSAFGAASGTEYATPENKRQKNVFYDRFFSGNTDRSPIINIINTKQSTHQESVFDTKYDLNKGLDVVKKGWVDNARLSGFNAEVFEKLEKGDFEGAVALNEKNGMFTLYEKDGAYIKWNDLSEEDKENADPNKIKSANKEDEERALILAQRNKPAKLQLQHKQDYHDLVAAINMYRSTHGDATRNWKPGVGSVKIGQSVDDFNNAALKAIEDGELTSGLVELVGDDEVTKNYNDKLKKFLITGRALELNQDVSKLKEESFIPSLIYKSDEFADYTADEQVELFPEYMKEIGVEMTDDWKKVTREGGDWGAKGGIEAFGTETDMREIAEGGRDFVKHIAPLVASLAITKRIPLGFTTKMDKAGKALRLVPSSKTLGGEVSKRFTGIGNWMKGTKLGKTAIGKRVIDVGIGGAEELVYLSLADQVGGKLFDMDPMVYNPETDDLNWEFAFGLGAGNVIGKKVINKLSNTGWGSSFLSRVSKVKTLEKATQRGLGATAGVGSMEIAKIFSGDSELVKLALDGGELTEEQKNEMKLGMTKQMASDWIGMFALGYITPGGKVGEAMQKDIQNFNINVLNTSKAAKKLGIKENVGADAIETAVNKKKAETTKKWLKSKRTEEDANIREKELKEINDAASDMNGRLHIKLAKELISGDKKRLAEVERQIYVFNRKIGTGEKLNGQNILDLAGMKKAEFDYLLKKMNNPMAAEALNARRDFYVGAREYVKDFKNITNRKEAVKFLEETVEYLEKNRELEALKSDKSANNGAKIEVAKLELEPIKQKHTDRLVELNNKYKEAVNRELLVAKKIATSLGAEFEIAKDTDAYIKKGGKAGTAGYHYIEKGKSKILVDPAKAAEAQTIGTGIHETVHHILKDAFKKDGKVTNEGIAIIDKFLDSLGDKDRKFLEGEIEQRDYKSKKKEDYYEEYLTTYVEGLKNKDIKLDLSTAQKIENVLLPHLNKVFPNLGKKTIKYSTKDAESLKEMLNDIFSESERLGNMSKYEVKDFIVESPIKTAEAYEAFSSEKSFSKYPEMKKINAVGEKYTREEWKNGKWREGFNEILPEVIKVLTKKSAEANAKNPGIIADAEAFAYQIANQMSGLGEGQRNIGGHIKNFDITEKKYEAEGKEFGLSGWINSVANKRLLTVLKKADKIVGAKKTKSLDVEDAKELVYEGPSAMDIIDTKITNETAKRILLESEKQKLHEVMSEVQTQKGKQAKQIHDGIRQRFTTTTPEGKEMVDVNKLMETVSGKKMKNLPRLALPETIDLFVRDKALAQKIANKIKEKKNLDGKDIKALQDGLDRWVPMIAEYVIPEGFITKEVKYKEGGITKSMQVPGETTNVPRKIQAITHNKRSIAGETTIDGRKIRSNENYFGQYKKPITSKLLLELREAMGFMKDGTRNLNTRKNQPVEGLEGVGETLKGVVMLAERMFTSQGLRAPMSEMGKIFEPEMLAIADGKPPKSWSKLKTKDKWADLVIDVELNSAKWAKINDRVSAGEPFHPIMLQDVFGKETGPMRTYLESRYKEAKGLTVAEKIEKIASEKDYDFSDKEIEMREKAEAESTKKQALDNDIDPNRVNLKGYVNQNLNAIKQRADHHVLVLNRMPFHHKYLPKEAITALVTELGWGSKSRKEVLIEGGEGFYLKQTGTSKDVAKNKSETLDNYYGKEKLFDNGSVYDGRYDACFVPKNFGDLKRSISKEAKRLEKLVENKKITQETADMNLVDFVRGKFSWNGKSSGYEATVKANEALAKDFYTARFKTAKAEGVKTIIVDGKKVKVKLGLENAIIHNAMQSNHSTGITKAMVYNLGHIAWKGSQPGAYKFKNKKGELKEYKTKDELHWEHERQLLNTNEHWVNILNRHKTVTPEMLKDLDIFIETSTQSLIEKTLQLQNDAKGRTSYSEHYTGNLTANGILNVLTRKGAEANQLMMSGPYKGKRMSEKLAGEFSMVDMKKVLETLPKELWGPEAYIVEATNIKSRESVIKNNNKLIESVGIKNYSKLKGRNQLQDLKNISKALKLGRKRNKKARGMSTFDFDETVGVSENFVIATKDGKTKKIASDKWPFVGEKMVGEGWKMDFSDFNKVTKGKPGPLMEKMKNQIKKFGPENVFILTARAKESAPAIHEWLKTQDVKIPLKNITGLGNSTGEAKALWMLEKFAEGYNDMYFVDDALPNVKAVKDVLGQLDIKSKVQQAYSKVNLNKGVNKIMEHSLDIGSEKVFSKAEAKVRGKDIKRRRVFMRDSAADLELLIEPLYGKGKKGIENKKWFRENFVMPFERGTRDYNTARQSAKNDYMGLRKQNKDVVKEISKEVEGTTFTNDMAMRVYLWNKAGYKIPDLAKTTEAKLVQHIANNPKLQAYAEQFARITKQEKGLKEPGENWWGETMAGEVTNINRGVSRKQYLQEWIDVKNEIFTEENLNKMESKLGTRWRENIEDMFDRMETGRTRSLKMDRGSAAMMNYLNGGIGTIMNFNTRSAVLQTISTTNFLNMRENNPIAAARAMGNVKQFAKDFKYIMNSDMLKQRRDGLAMNVTEAEIASAAASSKNPVQSIISKVLKAGYLPTKMADSFAISFGGATFYRNRIKMYEKQGMKTKEAEKQAFLDFQVIAERTQQSSRADLLSKQQTSLIGRFILPFANTPMQMNRAGMKDILDISKGRFKGGRELTEKVGRISYYMGAQVAVFAGLQSALFAMLLNDDDVSDEKIANTKSMMLNTTTDSFLRGFGIQGAVMSAFKNATQEYFKQSAKPGFTADYSEVAEDLLNISPPIGSKFGMLDRAGDTKKWAKIKKNDEFKFELGNPSLEASLMTIQATTNAPVYSPYQNIFNMSHAMSDQYETWQRFLMGTGWTPYSVGVETDRDKKKKKSGRKKSKTQGYPTIGKF